MSPYKISVTFSRLRSWLAIVVCTCTALSAAETQAQVVTPTAEALSALDTYIEEYLAANNVPGALVAVASRSRLLHLQTYGYANVELSVPVVERTVFEIGSISKQFVAAATMLLVEENKVALEDPVHRFLPYLPSEWLGVTVRQLLNHTSGIPDYEEIRSYDVYRFRMTPEDVIHIANSRPMDFVPGTGWYYSNTGYFLLSMLVERVEGKPLGAVLQDRIFKPLSMASTRMADPERIIPHRAAGYWVNKADELINRPATETSSTLGAGGLLSSAEDLAKWDAALNANDLLAEASRNAMWAATILPDGRDTEYGFGWRVTPYLGLESQSHTGQVAGFNANFARFPAQEIAIIVFMNRYRVNSSPLKSAVLHTFMPSLGPVPVQ